MTTLDTGMSTLDTGLTLIRTASRRVSAANGWMGNAFKSWMPTGLYARALLIMIVPMVCCNRWSPSCSWSGTGTR
jgi:hypothetical protein